MLNADDVLTATKGDAYDPDDECGSFDMQSDVEALRPHGRTSSGSASQPKGRTPLESASLPKGRTSPESALLPKGRTPPESVSLPKGGAPLFDLSLPTPTLPSDDPMRLPEGDVWGPPNNCMNFDLYPTWRRYDHKARPLPRVRHCRKVRRHPRARHCRKVRRAPRRSFTTH